MSIPRSCFSYLAFLLLLVVPNNAFAPSGRRSTSTARKMAVVVDMPPSVAVVAPAFSLVQQQAAPLEDGIHAYVAKAASGVAAESGGGIPTPTMLLSLQDRKIPTADEIAQKKLTFNVIFWGGGIVAPFIATVFYFGFKFWEK